MSQSSVAGLEGSGSSPTGNPTPSFTPKGSLPSQVKKLTHSEMQSRKEKGLCFNCEKFISLGIDVNSSMFIW